MKEKISEEEGEYDEMKKKLKKLDEKNYGRKRSRRKKWNMRKVKADGHV